MGVEKPAEKAGFFIPQVLADQSRSAFPWINLIAPACTAPVKHPQIKAAMKFQPKSRAMTRQIRPVAQTVA